jgi:hypothetical protein
MERIGLKEWAIVCEALGRGDQSIILRKGGIAEGRQGFGFRHHEFFVFPTWFHEQPEKARRIDLKFPSGDPEKIDLRFFAKVDLVKMITSWEAAQALEPFHILKPEVIRERFEYGDPPGIYVALLRVFRVAPVWTIPNQKKYGGCRSWVTLPEPPAELRFEPVISDAKQSAIRVQLDSLMQLESKTAVS